MAVVTQPVLPLIPIEATPIGPITALVEKPGEGGVVYVNGLATFCFDADDELGAPVGGGAVGGDRDRAALAGRVRVRGHSEHAVALAATDSPPRAWRGWCRANAARPGRSS